MKILINYFLVMSLLIFSASIYAGNLSVPNTFSSGTTAVAAEVNDNFTAVKTAVNDNDSRIAVLEAALAALQVTVTSQASTITTLENNITTANGAINILQSLLISKADVVHNHDARYSSISHDHVGIYAPVNHGHAQADVSGLISSLAGKANTSHNHVQSDITGLVTSLNTHTSQISAINNSNVMDLDAYLTISTTGKAKATLSGINLQIVNGMGSTGTINGLGNLIIGYDEINLSTDTWMYTCTSGEFTSQLSCESNGETWGNSHKTGSHYLVLGSQNNYSQYGGMVAGLRNTVNRNFSTITAGRENKALGSYSSVSGGMLNKVYGHYGSISGGRESTVADFAPYGSVAGGLGNYAAGSYSSVSGGRNRSAGGAYFWRAGSLFETN